MSLVTLATLALTLICGADLDRPSAPESPLDRAAIVKEADRLLETAGRDDATTPSELRERLVETFGRASRLLGDHSLSADRLDRAVETIAKLDLDDREATGILLATLAEVRDDLAFRPTMESDLPVGFPRFTPVGEIEVKSYPVYRMAKAEMRRSGPMQAGTFWTLFNHIKKHDIAMTAPVQMDYAETESNGEPVEAAMSFLYGSTDLGSTGRDGQVDVTDAEPGLAVSIGLRGYKTEPRVMEAKGLLDDWLKTHADGFEADGEIRTMEYNSPWVRGDRRYFEVQLPVRRVADAREI